MEVKPGQRYLYTVGQSITVVEILNRSIYGCQWEVLYVQVINAYYKSIDVVGEKDILNIGNRCLKYLKGQDKQ